MAKRPTPSKTVAAELTVEQMAAGIERLRRRIADLENFDPYSISNRGAPEVSALEKSIEEALERTFGADTTDFHRYSDSRNLDGGGFVIGRPATIAEIHGFLADGRASSLALLKQAVKGLEERVAEWSGPAAATQWAPITKSLSNEVFLVHGHDHEMLQAVARFLEKLKFSVKILHEQPNSGQTIIEKLEAHGSRSDYAVVLITPDDVGGLSDQELRSRARQNVILEWGFFAGLFSRARVCALVKGEVELPSDLHGIGWHPLDGNWKISLAKELAAAGYSIDWNDIMK